MPGQIAPAYVATDANSLITAVTTGWFDCCGAMQPCVVPRRIPSPRCRPDCLRWGGIFATLRTECVDVDCEASKLIPCREMRCF